MYCDLIFFGRNYQKKLLQQQQKPYSVPWPLVQKKMLQQQQKKHVASRGRWFKKHVASRGRWYKKHVASHWYKNKKTCSTKSAAHRCEGQTITFTSLTALIGLNLKMITCSLDRFDRKPGNGCLSKNR